MCDEDLSDDGEEEDGFPGAPPVIDIFLIRFTMTLVQRRRLLGCLSAVVPRTLSLTLRCSVAYSSVM
jgi:hypothetical protein